MPDDAWRALLAHRPEVLATGVAGIPVPGQDTWHLGPVFAYHLFDYVATVVIDGQPHATGPGCALTTPPGSTMRWIGPERPSRHIYALFRWPLARGLRLTPRSADGQAWLWPGLAQAALWMPRTPQRAALRLWDALWAVLDDSGAETAVGDLADAARRRLDAELARHQPLGRIARDLGVSQAHLCRVFRRAWGMSPGQYRRWRRAETAAALLRHTRLDVAAVASAAGLGDLQQCNKALRRAFGRSPRQLREGGVPASP